MRMPTEAEYQELLANTTNEWVSCSVMGGDHTSHEVMGRLFTSKTDSSKKLFFPAAGLFVGSFDGAGSYGHYWSSSVSESSSEYGSFFGFFQEKCMLTCDARLYGFPIRGVFNN